MWEECTTQKEEKEKSSTIQKQDGGRQHTPKEEERLHHPWTRMTDVRSDSLQSTNARM